MPLYHKRKESTLIMVTNEIALQLTLAMIQKGDYRIPESNSNTQIGKSVAELYNAIFDGIKED